MRADLRHAPRVELSSVRRIHVVGVGGVGMSAIATVLVEMGHAVSGSDVKASPTIERLRALGVDVGIGHAAGHVEGADVVTSSPAVPEGNVELVHARALGIPTLRRAEILESIARERRTISVAGTHGKTTTASMLSLALVDAGARPSFLIGADVNEIGTNAAWDEGEWLVLEADESYGSFDRLSPEVALVTNIEPDHLDHYKTFGSLVSAFEEYLAAARVRVVNGDDPVAARVGHELGATTVGTSEGASYRIERLALARSSSTFDVVGPDGPLGHVQLPVPGEHNARNAVLAIAGACCVGVPFDVSVSALARFTGVPRRFEFRGESGGVSFVDDYAHLPSEVRATLAAARAGGWRRIVVVFQPHRYTRVAALAESFASAFDDADLVFVTDVYSAGEAPVPGVSGRLVSDAIADRPGSPRTWYVAARAELRASVNAALEDGDLCCTLGAGDLTTLPDELIALRERG